MCVVLHMRQQRLQGIVLHQQRRQLQMAAFFMSHAQRLPDVSSCSPTENAGLLSTPQESLMLILLSCALPPVVFPAAVWC